MWNWIKKGSDTFTGQGIYLNADLAQEAPKWFIVRRQRIAIRGRSLYYILYLYPYNLLFLRFPQLGDSGCSQALFPFPLQSPVKLAIYFGIILA